MSARGALSHGTSPAIGTGEGREMLVHALQAGKSHLALGSCHPSLGKERWQGRWMGRERQVSPRGSRTSYPTHFPADQS